MPNDFSDSNDELFQYNRKINTFSLLSLGLIHYFSSHCVCYFLFTCCCPSKDTLRKTRVRSYLPHLLVQKWYFCLCSCFRNHGDSLLTWAAAARVSSLLLTEEEAALCHHLQPQLWIRVLPAVPFGTRVHFCGCLFYRVNLTS